MKIKLLQTKVYVNNRSRKRTRTAAGQTERQTDRQPNETWSQSARQDRQTGKSILKMLTSESICLMGPHVAQDRPKPNSDWDVGVCPPLIRQITKVCASVGAVACGCLPRAAIISTPLDERPCPGPAPGTELLHLINSRLKCICSWAPDRGKGAAETNQAQPSQTKTESNRTELGSGHQIYGNTFARISSCPPTRDQERERKWVVRPFNYHT